MFNSDLVPTPSQTEPLPDICRDHKREMFDRPAVFLPLIVVMFASFIFIFVLDNLPYGIQVASLIPYTAFVVLTTFSAQRGLQPYFFECPIVRSALPRLAQRHGYFLVGLIALETVALQLRPDLPNSWLVASRRDGSPFGMTLTVLCMCLALAQILSNRSLLDRAHIKSGVVL